MKKLLLVALALVAAGSIAFAISALSGSTGSSTPAAAQVQQDPSSRASTLAMGDCIWYVGILECVPSRVNWCYVTFRAYHWDKSQDCCAHDAGTLWFRVGAGGAYTAMTESGSGHDNVTGCDFHTYDSAQYELGNNAMSLYRVYDSAATDSCIKSDSLYIHCQ